jgi:type II secretory pathway pseudopilin PulG
MRLILRAILRLAPHLMRSRPSADVVTVTVLLVFLLTIICPAILYTRYQAQRQQAKNQLRQLGLSLQNYHETFLRYPANVSIRQADRNPPNEEANTATDSNDAISPLTILGPSVW